MDLPSPGQPPSPEIDFLYSLRRGETRLGLGSTRRLLAALGHPERGIPFVHVAGTNGKGSTTALAAAMLQAGGVRTGRFTSPHVLRVEERICVDAVPIDAESFRRRVRELRPRIERAGASFFEAMTAIAALHFRDAGVEAAVYEVGLGGRLDATNAMRSAVSVLTGVGHDHEAILGRGLRAVCREKLAIAKRGVPFFAALDRPDLVRLARETCARVHAPLHLVRPDVARILGLDLDSGSEIELGLEPPLRVRCGFLGVHQARNVALAALAVRALHARGGIERPPAVAAGSAAAFLPGRFQVLRLPGGRTVVLDVGHNPEALHATLDVVEAVLPGQPVRVVLGLLRDKKLDGVGERLGRLAREIILTSPGVERAWDPQAARPSFKGPARCRVEPRVEDAVRRALEGGDGPLLVMGSHYLLGEALPVLAERLGTTAERLLRPAR